MGTLLLNLGLKLLTSNAAKTLIAMGINKLIAVQGDGITKDVAKVMIEGIAKSKHNPTTEDVFKDALQLLDTDEGK
jgi:hypothetical protein